MKKVLIPILLTAIAVLSVQSCNMGEAVLQAAIKAANEQCPNNMGDGMVMTEIGYDGQNVVYSISCDAETYYLEQDLVTDEMKQSMIDELLTNEASDKNVKTFLTLVRKADAGITYQYYVPGTDQTMDVTLEPGDF